MMVSPQQELDRLGALCASGMLDTPPEERFDRITRLAAQFFDVPMVLVSLIDEHRQWFKSRYGMTVQSTPRSQAFCAHAVEGRQRLVVEDARLDPRFVNNPLVTAGPLIRFYAGQPIFSADGHALGTLCILDTEPRALTPDQLVCLGDFAMLVTEEFNKISLAESAISRTEALVETEARFQATFEQAAVGMAHVDLEGRLIKVNQKFCDIVGYDAGELERLTFQTITHPDDLDTDIALFRELLAGYRGSYSIEKRYAHRAGHHVWVNLTVALLRTIDGTPAYFVSVIEDIQEKKEAQLALHRLNEALETRVKSRTAELEKTVAKLGVEVAQRMNVEAELRLSEEHTRTILEASHDAFVGIDGEGIIFDWNKAAERTFGWTAQEVIGTNLTATIIPAEHHHAHRLGMEKFLRTGRGDVINRRLELPSRTKDGRTLAVEMTISAYFLRGSWFFGAFLHDISERQEAAKKLESKQRLLDAVLESVDVGVVACNEHGVINLINRAAAAMMIFEPPDSGGTAHASASRLYQSDGKTLLTDGEHPLHRVLAGEILQNVEMTIVAAAGAPRHVFASGRQLAGAGNANLGAVIALNDVTQLKNAERQRALNESRLRAITENLPSLIGHIDEDERFLYLNNHALRFYGKTSEQLIGTEVRALYSEAEYLEVKPYIDSARAGKKASFESNMVVAGKLRHFSAVYIPEQRDGPGPRGFFAMAMDITARKNSELRQAESEERLRTITDNLPVLIAYIDNDEVYRFANATYQQWFGIAPEQMIGKTIEQVIGTELYAAGKHQVRANLDGHATRFETTYFVDGISRTAEVVGVPHIKDGLVQGMYVMTTDISATKKHELQLQQLARSDALTSLPNRRSYEEKLEEAAMRSARSGSMLGLVFLDIDFFKQINDTYGHGGGDEVLREFGARLRSAVRATDTVCRLAGDEFTIILEGMSHAGDVEPIAEKILHNIRNPFVLAGQGRDVTTSIGIATCAGTAVDIAELSKQADDALYQAKIAGRNRYAVFGLTAQ